MKQPFHAGELRQRGKKKKKGGPEAHLYFARRKRGEGKEASYKLRTFFPSKIDWGERGSFALRTYGARREGEEKKKRDPEWLFTRSPR